ncbi:DUF4817 domain-containing protein [Trichonephila clavipes]|nr:DUF4817 domain-containing protein [Trichonephila clavipes]
MNEAAAEIHEKNNFDEVVQCGVSVDGTWQRRGHLSLNGCVSAISIDTGNWKVGRSSTSRTTMLERKRAPCIAVETEVIASEAASGTSSAREAARRLGLPPSSVRNILRRILQLYPYKLQSCHELLPADTAQREAFAKWAFSKMEQDLTWVFNILWTDEAHFSLHGDGKNHNCRIWATSNPREYTQKPLHSPKVTAWCGFTGSFIIGPFFFETQCPVSGWITETVNAQRYLTLLWETVVPDSRRSGKTESLAGAAGTHGSSVSRFNTDRLLVVRIFEISRVSIRSIKSVGTERCDPQRSILHTSGYVALCRCWICHSSGMSSPLWWWSCGTYSGVIKL